MTDQELIQELIRDVRHDERESHGRAIWHARCLQLTDTLESALTEQELMRDALMVLADLLDATVDRADRLEKALRHYADDHDKWLLRETRFANEALAEPATEEPK